GCVLAGPECGSGQSWRGSLTGRSLVGRGAADWISVCKERHFKALLELRLGFWLRGDMGSDVHACACGWDPRYGASSGFVSSFGSSATIGTGYLSGDR